MNLIEGLQAEANRRREAIKEYEAVGPVGAIGAALLRCDVNRAEAAIASGDVVQMVSVYKELSEEKIG